jgi:hypothetical protein
MAVGESDASVLLLHDQLQDARIWYRLEPAVATFAAVRTISLPPLHTIGHASAWADHIERHARAEISPGTVDLVLAIGGAGEAGIGLVSDGYADVTILVDPDLQPLIMEAIGPTEESAHRALGDPEISGPLEQFFQSLDPETVDEFATRGTVAAEGIDTFVDAILGQTGERDELLRQIVKDQLTATLPVDIEAQRRPAPKRPDWIARLAPVADRCTVAITASPLYRFVGFEEVLRARTPDAELVHLTTPAPRWLHDPEEISTLIRNLLDRPRRRAQ